MDLQNLIIKFLPFFYIMLIFYDSELGRVDMKKRDEIFLPTFVIYEFPEIFLDT